jgi:hypothetical protein
VAGGTAFEVRAHAGDPVIGVGAFELEVDVLIEPLKALVAEQLRLGGPEASWSAL